MKHIKPLIWLIMLSIMTLQIACAPNENVPSKKTHLITVSITADKEIYIEHTLVTFSELRTKLEAMHNKNIPVILRADRSLNYEAVMQVVEQIKATGFTQVIMATVGIHESIRSQLSRCLTMPSNAKNTSRDLTVVLRVKLEKNGSVKETTLSGNGTERYNSDPIFKAVADSFINSVRKCSPFKDLPPEKYHTWRDMELTFDPKEMLF